MYAQDTIIWPDFSQTSARSNLLRELKRINSKTFWVEMLPLFQHDYLTLPKDHYKLWASNLIIPFETFRNQDVVSINDSTWPAIFEGSNLYKEALWQYPIGIPLDHLTNFFTPYYDFLTTRTRACALSHLISANITPEQIQQMEVIVEIGAGTGDMADIVHKLGFKGKYIIFDFAEVSLMQKWYHDQLGLKNITYVTDPAELEPADLTIAAWSFTEMGLELRNEIVKAIGTNGEWMIAYSDSIFEIDNADYLTSTFAPLFSNRHCLIQFFDASYVTGDGGTRYLVIKNTK